jgi:hypothetical protein
MQTSHIFRIGREAKGLWRGCESALESMTPGDSSASPVPLRRLVPTLPPWFGFRVVALLVAWLVAPSHQPLPRDHFTSNGETILTPARSSRTSTASESGSSAGKSCFRMSAKIFSSSCSLTAPNHCFLSSSSGAQRSSQQEPRGQHRALHIGPLTPTRTFASFSKIRKVVSCVIHGFLPYRRDGFCLT